MKYILVICVGVLVSSGLVMLTVLDFSLIGSSNSLPGRTCLFAVRQTLWLAVG
jgi:hypothetical protein